MIAMKMPSLPVAGNLSQPASMLAFLGNGHSFVLRSFGWEALHQFTHSIP
jgi:hypothetical protein